MKECLKKYRGCLFMVGLLVFLVHGAKLNSGVVGIDTEDLIHLQNDFYGGWLNTGRQGLVLLKLLLGNMRYNPYFTGAVTLLLFTAAVSAFLWLWDREAGKPAGMWAWGCGAVLWISHPAMAEQFYFSLQSMEICGALVLTAVALYWSFQWADRCSKPCMAGSILLLVLTFSVYQTFVVLYISGVVTLLLTQAVSETAEGGAVKGRIFARRVAFYLIVFLAAFLLNTLITSLFFSSSNYLGDQIFWGRASVKDCLHGIAGHVVRAFTGYDSLFYNAGFGVLALADLILLVRFLAGSARKGTAGAVLFFYLALLSTPFLMSLVLGGTPAIRSQLVLPAVTGFLGCFGIRLLNMQKGRFRKTWHFTTVLGCLAAVCLVSGMEQAKVTGQLYYTDQCRYEQDAALGRSVMEQIDRVGRDREDFTVIVIGGREFSGNASCVTGEVIGRSFFNYDRDVEPRFYWSTRRVLGFLHTLGGDYEQVPVEWVQKAVEYSRDMPEWPAEDSVQERDGIVILKLSSD